MISAETQSMFISSMVINFNRPQQNVDALIRRTLAGIDPNLTVNGSALTRCSSSWQLQ